MMNFSRKIEFRPKLASSLKHYSIGKFKEDLVAGIVVGIVALPLAIAFGIASGVTPTVGLVTAIIGGFCVSAFGGNPDPDAPAWREARLRAVAETANGIAGAARAAARPCATMESGRKRRSSP